MKRTKSAARLRVGRVSVYAHHGSFYIYYQHNDAAVRQRVGTDSVAAELEASLINAKMAAVAGNIDLAHVASRLWGQSVSIAITDTVVPAGVPELRQAFLAYHEKVLQSSLNTIVRYAGATAHLERFAASSKLANALSLSVDAFTEYLRSIEVASNGHDHTAKRRLRDRGVRYVLETCRSMYRWGIRRGPLPRNAANPFSDAGLSRLKIRDSKPIFTFNEEQELQFFIAASPWAFVVHAILSKTGMRPGELVHLLIEDVDTKGGWLNVCGKPELGWSLKAGHDRRIPLVPEVLGLIQWLMGARSVGPLLLRECLNSKKIVLVGDRDRLRRVADERLAHVREKAGGSFTRAEAARTFKCIWRDAGATKEDRVRSAFIRAAKAAGLKATCPKSWRHTFATLLQEAHVDVLVRQLTLGHKPAAPEATALGMTGVYTHTSPTFQRSEIERAIRLRPRTLEFFQTWLERHEKEHGGSL